MLLIGFATSLARHWTVSQSVRAWIVGDDKWPSKFGAFRAWKNEWWRLDNVFRLKAAIIITNARRG
jgi:hypothetical protein